MLSVTPLPRDPAPSDASAGRAKSKPRPHESIRGSQLEGYGLHDTCSSLFNLGSSFPVSEIEASFEVPAAPRNLSASLCGFQFSEYIFVQEA